MGLLSAYERKARLIPGLLGIVPVAVAIATLGLKQFPAVAVVLAIASATGGTYLLAVLVANSGRRAQAKLWVKWGSRPTSHVLRLHGATDNPVQRDDWRRALSAHTGRRLLSAAKEKADPAAADHAIEAAVDRVLHYGQDERFPILLSENAQYGLERNLYGFRWIGRGVSLACAFGLVAALFWADWVRRGAVVAGTAICGVLFLIWLIAPSERRTKEAGFRYAKQLMRSVIRAEELKSEATPPPTDTKEQS